MAPPYTPAEGVTTLPDGTLVTRLGDGREWRFHTPGERDATFEENATLLQRLRAGDEGAQRFLSFGVYCDGHLCFRLSGNLCELRVEEALTQFRRRVAEDGQLAGLRLEITIALQGHLEERCAFDDAACAPIPYNGGTYDPEGPRRTGPLAEHSAGACQHDGECYQAGCGNHCLSWDYGGAGDAATCEGYSLDRAIYCGCVEGQCAWFSQ